MKYYFLLCALPKLSLDAKPDISFDELLTFFTLNLSGHDYSKVMRLRSYIDVRNLRYLWQGKPIEGRGSLSEKELEEAVLVRDSLPLYVFDFLDKY